MCLCGSCNVLWAGAGAIFLFLRLCACPPPQSPLCVISFPDLMKRHSSDNRIYTMRVGVDVWGANNILNDPLKPRVNNIYMGCEWSFESGWTMFLSGNQTMVLCGQGCVTDKTLFKPNIVSWKTIQLWKISMNDRAIWKKIEETLGPVKRYHHLMFMVIRLSSMVRVRSKMSGQRHPPKIDGRGGQSGQIELGFLGGWLKTAFQPTDIRIPR